MNGFYTAERREPGLVVSCRKIPPGASYKGSRPHWVAGLTLDGACEHGQPGGKRFLMKKGDFLVIRPNTTQRILILGRTDWRAIDCIFDPRPHWVSWLNWEEIAPGFMKLSLHDSKARREIRNGFLRAYRLGKSGLPEATDLVYHAIEQVLMSANRCYRQSRPSEYDPRVNRAVQYLAENLSSPLSLKEVAEHCNLSRPRLAYLFKKQVGIGPIAFHNQQRIRKAAQMIRMSFLSVKQIAFELGFKNPKYFSACFRKITGVNPRKYRTVVK